MKWKIRYFDIFFYSILIIFVVTLGIILFPAFEKNVYYPLKYSEYVEKYCNEYEVEKTLCYSMMKSESGFNKNVVSNSGAIGLMQITLPTGVFIAEKLGETVSESDLKNPETNIKYGLYYVNYLQKKFPGKYEMLAAYNAGEGRVTEWLKDSSYSENGNYLIITPYKETNNYIERPLKYYYKYKNYYKELDK